MPLNPSQPGRPNGAPAAFSFAPRCGAMLATAVTVALVGGCAETSQLRQGQDAGATPVLVTPRASLLPTVKIAPARGWSAQQQPQPAAGLQVGAFARGLEHPRWLHVLPNGDVLVAETNAPERPAEYVGLKGWAMKLVMKLAGAATPSADRITLLRDADGDGIAELRTPFLTGLHSPLGMQLVGERLYVANTDAVVWFPYLPGQTTITAAPTRLASLPAGPRNHHWTKNLIASADGRTLYVTVGSNSNVGEHGLQEEAGRAAVLKIDVASGAVSTFASGLRNPNGLAWGDDGRLWTVVNERDELGSDLVPDYLVALREGGFYGWPYSYWGGHVDARVQPPRSDLAAAAQVPDYALGAHVAALGLAHAGRAALGPAYAQGMFIGLHGSWNRRPLSGYKVVFVPFARSADGRSAPAGPMVDVLTGFLDADERARGRPVGVAVDARGGLLVADDVGNTVWRVQPESRGHLPGRSAASQAVSKSSTMSACRGLFGASSPCPG